MDLLSPRQRFSRLLNREEVDRPAWAVWRHLPHHDYTPEFVAAHIRDLRRSDGDLWKITIRPSFPVRDYGIEDAFDGDPLGRPCWLNTVIHEARDWRRLEPLNPATGILGQTGQDIRRIASAAPVDRPVLVTLFSPLTQAARLAGWPCLLQHWKDDLPAVMHGLEVLAESTRRFIKSLATAPLDGIFYGVQECGIPEIMGDHARFSGLDRSILETNPYPLNLLHLHGHVLAFDAYCRYPVSILHWDEVASGLSLPEGGRQFPGIVSGGIDWPTQGWSSPDAARKAMEATLRRIGTQPAMLSAGCVIPYQATHDEIMATKPCRKG